MPMEWLLSDEHDLMLNGNAVLCFKTVKFHLQSFLFSFLSEKQSFKVREIKGISFFFQQRFSIQISALEFKSADVPH